MVGVGGSANARAAAVKRLPAPRSLKATKVLADGVTLRWAAPKGAKPAQYVVLRDGKAIAKTKRTTFTDRKVKAGATYRYSVRALDSHKRVGALSSSVRVKVPKLPPVGPAPTNNVAPPLAPVAPPDPGPGPAPAPEPPPPLTAAMVERLFWRAGFGSTPAQRAAWAGRTQAELVDWFLDTPRELAPTATPPLTGDTPPEPIDPAASDTELELEWIDAMQRAINPLPDRLAFFWHRHWAISREEGDIPLPWVVGYRNLLLQYADLGRYPGASFRSLAYDMTTRDPAMSLYLNLYQNVRGKPNENYAREFMELFCLGPTGPDGAPNYSQDDVAGLAKAFTGWQLQTDQAKPAYGTITFNKDRFDLEAKAFLGASLPKLARAADAKPEMGPAAINLACDTVLAHANHAQFLIRKLWGEFIASPIPQATLDALTATYRGSGYQIKPLIRAILMDRLIFESPGEPNLIKPPIVYLVGVLRAFGAPLRGTSMQGAMNNMQQRVYRPPNVAGWEGGLAWLNTNTVQGRWDLVTRVQYLKYSNYYAGGGSAPHPVPPDVPGETPEAAFDRAYELVGRPWLSDATRASLLSYARTLSAANQNGTATAQQNQRRQRIYTLQALMLGGPDGQVM
jgi:uncharacterized protein (DUF1800 family)